MTTSLRRILGYHWWDRNFNIRVLEEAAGNDGKVGCVIHECQLHVWAYDMPSGERSCTSHSLITGPSGVGSPNSSLLAFGWHRYVCMEYTPRMACFVYLMNDHKLENTVGQGICLKSIIQVILGGHLWSI